MSVPDTPPLVRFLPLHIDPRSFGWFRAVQQTNNNTANENTIALSFFLSLSLSLSLSPSARKHVVCLFLSSSVNVLTMSCIGPQPNVAPTINKVAKAWKRTKHHRLRFSERVSALLARPC